MHAITGIFVACIVDIDSIYMYISGKRRLQVGLYIHAHMHTHAYTDAIFAVLCVYACVNKHVAFFCIHEKMLT